MSETSKKGTRETLYPERQLADFLESSPPNQITSIPDLWSIGRFSQKEINAPELTLECTQVPCQGQMRFRCEGNNTWQHHYLKQWHGLSFSYTCKNCGITKKLFSLIISAERKENDDSGLIVKLGEWPPFGPMTPNRLLRMLGADKDLFLQGRRAENQGLGIGAFTYYRRVVENQKNILIDEIIKVANKVEDSPNDIVADLVKAKETFQFSQAIKDIKLAIPKALEIEGRNPLLLLHGVLSAGIHDKNDDECLELAKSIRFVLVELMQKMEQALAEKKELKKAVSKLLQT